MVIENFEQFKNNWITKEIFGKASINIENFTCWHHLRVTVLHNQAFASKIINTYRVASSGERLLIQAITYALGFKQEADELEQGFYIHLHRISGDYRAIFNYILSVQDFLVAE